jgi:hypothetical protein
MALALRVSTRRWRAGAVGPHRDLSLLRRRSARVRRGALSRLLWVCTDGLCADVRAIRETCRAPERRGAQGRPRWRPWRHVCSAQVVKRSQQRRVIAVERRIVEGTPACVETLRRRSPGDGVINTADSERLKATFREHLAALTRRGRALARRPVTWHQGMYRIGTVDNFCTPQASLQEAGRATTPARAAGITAHGCTVRALRLCRVPPSRWTPPKPRGRPSRALQRLVKRWCS